MKIFNIKSNNFVNQLCDTDFAGSNCGRYLKEDSGGLSTLSNCFCNLSLSFKNYLENVNYKNKKYHKIKVYKSGVSIPIYDSGLIQID
jgi:hypothetical protein